MTLRKFRRCYDNHTVPEVEGNNECHYIRNGKPCMAPLLESMYDTDDKGLVYSAGGGWGNAIKVDFPKEAFDGDTTVLSGHGWKQRIPHVGDYIQQEMKSGQHLILHITEVDKCGDPPDMFFFKCKAVNYLENMKSFEPIYETDIRKENKVNFF